MTKIRSRCPLECVGRLDITTNAAMGKTVAMILTSSSTRGTIVNTHSGHSLGLHNIFSNDILLLSCYVIVIKWPDTVHRKNSKKIAFYIHVYFIPETAREYS